MTKNKIFSIILIASLIAGIGAVAAVNYVLQTSTAWNTTVSSGTVNVPVTLIGNATSLSDLDHLNLTATVTNAGAVGLTVVFRDGSAIVGSAAIANVGGVFKAEIEVVGSVGSHSYTAGP